MKDFDLIFLSTFDYPSRFAHALHGLHMARAFTRVLPGRFLFLINTVVRSDVLRDVPYRRLFGPFGRRIKKFGLRRILLVPVVLVTFLFRRPRVVYTTDPGLYSFVAFLKRMFGVCMVVECHGALSPVQSRELAHADLCFFVTHALKDSWCPAGVRGEVLSNAVDIESFTAVPDDMPTLRSELGLPVGFLVGYIGRFEPLGFDKGLRLMLDALVTMPDVHMLFLGGDKKEVKQYEGYAQEKRVKDRVTILSHVSSDLVPRYTKACDLLAYVPEKNDFTEHETSPMKLFEYMASGRPIIVSDTPALREVLTADEAFFIEPEETAFKEMITQVRSHPAEGEEKAARAKARAAKNTWDARAERIVQLIEDVV